jgi:hypothetical protein
MKYMLTIFGEEGGMEDASPEEQQQASHAWSEITEEMKDKGVFEAGEGLQPSTTATTVRGVGNGEPSVTDGPFAETKEALGGFYLLECRDLDEAIEMAAKIPAARRGTIEVRPIWVLPADYGTTGGGDAS